MQKIFAKKSIKREKRKEKDHRKKVEKSKFKLIWTNFTLVNGNAKASCETLRLLKLNAQAPRTMADW